MEAISLKLPKDLLEDGVRCAAALKMSRAAYIRQAITEMNRRADAQIRARQMEHASHRVRKESLKINAEFAAVERDPDECRGSDPRSPRSADS